MGTRFFTPIGDIIATIAKKHKVKSQLEDSHICFILNQYLSQLCKTKGKNCYARATELKKGTIIITVNTSSMAQEVTLRQLAMKELLHERGYDQMKQIKVKLV